jgi:hypothetical protein
VEEKEASGFATPRSTASPSKLMHALSERLEGGALACLVTPRRTASEAEARAVAMAGGIAADEERAAKEERWGTRASLLEPFNYH